MKSLYSYPLIALMFSALFFLVSAPANALEGYLIPGPDGELHLVDPGQFAPTPIDTCPTFHLHAANGESVTAFDDTVIPEPEHPMDCGYGDPDLVDIPETVSVPDVAGKSLEDGTIDIENAGLVVGEITEETSDEPENTILSTDPPGGTFVEIGDSVNLGLSSGPEDPQLDNDNDGTPASEDPDDNNPCVPDDTVPACEGTETTLTIVKKVESDGIVAGAFKIVVKGPTSYNTELVTATGAPKTDGPRTVEPGDYSIKEMNDKRFKLSSANCEGASFTFMKNIIKVSISSGDNVICTFTNTPIAEFTIIKKLLDPLPPDGSRSDTFEFKIPGAISINVEIEFTPGETEKSATIPVKQGKYSVQELVPDGWELLEGECDDGTSERVNIHNQRIKNIIIAPGAKITCIFENGHS